MCNAKDNDAVSVLVSADFQETWTEICAFREYPIALLFKSLLSVMTTRMTRELVRWLRY